MSRPLTPDLCPQLGEDAGDIDKLEIVEKDELTGKMAPHFKGMEVLCEHAPLL